MSDLKILKEIIEQLGFPLEEVDLDDLSENNNSYVFQDEKVIGLNLSENQLTNLPSKIGRLTNLNYLHLSSNQLTTLPPEIGQLTTLNRLDLRSNQLTTLPPQIVQLTNLNYLNLRSNQLTTLPPKIGQLTKLNYLHLNSNQLTNLPPEIGQLTKLKSLHLSSNQLTNLPPEIGQLIKLKSLHLSSNQLTNLPPEIEQLTTLNYLYLKSSQLTNLPPEIVQLTTLNALDLRSNQLTKLPPEIGQLTTLNYLDLRSNQLTNLPPEIRQLTNLQALYLSKNQLTNLPPEIGQLTTLNYLDLSENQLTNLPPEIGQLLSLKELELPNNKFNIPDITERLEPQELIRYILNLQTQGKKPLNEGKMILLGNGAVGKTALVERLVEGTFSGNTKMTEGIAITPWQIEEITLNIWDFGGQEIMRAMHQFFMTERTLYVLVGMHRTDDSGTPIEDWLQLIQTFGGNSPVLIVVSHCDVHDLNLDEHRLKREYPNIVGFYRTSSKKNTGIDEVLSAIKRQITCEVLKHIKDDVPTRWIAVKEQLVKVQKKQDVLLLSEFKALCQQEGINDTTDRKILLQLLHDLGISFNYGLEEKLAEVNILNPEWVTKGIYAIINNQPFFRQKGEITRLQVQQLLRSIGNYKNKEGVIIGLMQQFDLCFKLKKDTYLVPDLLQKEEPYIGKEFDEGLELVYKYDFLPLSIMPQFITKVNHLTAEKHYWLYGVIISHKNNTALIRVNRTKQQIDISVIGQPSTRRSFLSDIKKYFTDLHLQLKGNLPTIFVPYESQLVDYQLLLEAEREGDTEIRIKGIKEKVNIKTLLDSVVTKKERELDLERAIDSAFKKKEQVEHFRKVQARQALESEIEVLENELEPKLKQQEAFKIIADRWRGIAAFLYWTFYILVAVLLTVWYIIPNWGKIEPFTLLFSVIIGSMLAVIPKQLLNWFRSLILENLYTKVSFTEEELNQEQQKLDNKKKALRVL